MVTVTTNNAETFWSILSGVIRECSTRLARSSCRYVDEATEHRNVRSKDTVDITGEIVKGCRGSS